MDKFIASEGLTNMYLDKLLEVGDWTDTPATVSLVTVPFEESADIDQATIPPDAATFNTKTSAGPIIVDTPESGGKSMVWPDPIGGFKFTSTAASPTGNAYGYRVDAGDNFLGAKTFPQPVIVDAADKVIYIGEIRLPINLDGLFTGE